MGQTGAAKGSNFVIRGKGERCIQGVKERGALRCEEYRGRLRSA